MSTIDPDADLIARARSAPEGDMRAFESLVRRHQSAVQLNCRYLSRSQDDAEDLAQEVFVKAFFGLHQFEGRSSFKSWIQRIKINHCLNFLRKRGQAEFTDVEAEGAENAPELRVAARAEASLEARDQRELIREVLDSMPESLRVALVLRDLDELSYQEVADTLGVGLSAAKMRIKRARAHFRERYASVASEDSIARASAEEGGSPRDR